MDLESMSMAELLDIHNELADTKAGPKTFASKAKLIERIAKTAEAKSIDGAVTAYVEAVKDGSFPAPEHCY